MPAPDAVKLSPEALPTLAERARIPAYERGAVSASIVHIGVGGFFRAHQAVYLDDLLHTPGNEAWGYCGVGLLPHDERMRDALVGQSGLYTVVERSAAGDAARVIGSLLEYLYAPADPEAVLEKMAAPACRIVSLTITEGGYYVNEGTGAFNERHPDIVHDLAHPHQPRCSFGYLLEALDRRRQRGLAPFTVMSCDNLQHNGDVARRNLLAFAQRRDPALHDWLAENGAFPNSMVDRITPATTDEHRALVRERFGIEDAWPVVTEPFLQWVIEDTFPGGRPAWEQVGAQMTDDVLPYEKMKMRLLNASHQAMCYIGMLLGMQYAHETMEDEGIRTLVQRMMDEEVTPLLSPVPGVDVEVYKQTLIERFSNPTICDQLSRIGTEGSARIPKFVLPSVAEQLERGGPLRRMAFTVAAWFRYLTGEDDAGKAMPIIDPMAETLQDRAKRGGREPDLLLSLDELFGERLKAKPEFVDEVRRALRSFYDQGARATLEAYL
ncbi:mannitol dehydrogenase family protein [Haliangium ochraceum]|uniref:Mannitol dehydrogenase domain protein n=1 Tax=Haliangium ochraceum (strain DSM 14365 / JCM 11303 / SMP-2) TaxID=502025 RepID=D0LPZ8_HALO1|nr:mannitol dehydrogenase family protein [Haliangium ochraceum]ACY17035.1 Mannitol dehydrogenase domain protein [Haliangium ochraceum DSM 14365]